MDVNKKVSQHDEMIAEMWRTIDRINADLDRLEARMDRNEAKQEERFIKADRRKDFSIKRLVNLEALDKKEDAAKKERNKWMAVYNKRTTEYLNRLLACEKWMAEHTGWSAAHDKRMLQHEKLIQDHDILLAEHDKKMSVFDKKLGKVRKAQEKERKLLVDFIDKNSNK